MLAEPLQQELVVQQAVQRPEEEDVERQVADPLLLKVPAQSLHLPAGPACGNVGVRKTRSGVCARRRFRHPPASPLQLHQALRVLLEVSGQLLLATKTPESDWNDSNGRRSQDFLFTLRAWMFLSRTSPIRW